MEKRLNLVALKIAALPRIKRIILLVVAIVVTVTVVFVGIFVAEKHTKEPERIPQCIGIIGEECTGFSK